MLHGFELARQLLCPNNTGDNHLRDQGKSELSRSKLARATACSCKSYVSDPDAISSPALYLRKVTNFPSLNILINNGSALSDAQNQSTAWGWRSP